LIGLSDPMIQTLLQRRMKGLPTLSSAQIGRLKNVQLSEKEIMTRIENGMTDAQADAEATAREKSRAHSGTGFTRGHGRRR
jgi:flagellar basal body rod protein FlgF